MTKQELCHILTIQENAAYNYQEISGIANHLWHKLQSLPDFESLTILALQKEEWFQKWIEQLVLGWPVQYVTGTAPFINLDLEVGQGVLIPRSETEEMAFWIHQTEIKKPRLRVLDIGTGSGCIAIYLKKQHPDWNILGIDISDNALYYAKRNAHRYDCEITFQKANFLNSGDWPEGAFDVIVSNPPYISSSEKPRMDLSVLEYEPAVALFPPGEDPELFYSTIASYACLHLNEQGSIYVELNEFRYVEAGAAFRKAGFLDISYKSDIQGKVRMLKARKNP